jgi:FMN phosphatase YigB (HAD superfamily)
MTLTLLLDLDDTLLDTNTGAFVPAYFQSLAQQLAGRVRPEVMLPALMSGTQLMLASNDPSRTLQEVFEADFYPKLGVAKEQLADLIEDFYDNVFPGLGAVTKQRAGAAELVEWARAQGYRLAIATDPLFPRKATYHRVRWAGLDPQRFDLISSFETFHFSKSHPAYFAEVLGRLGWPDGPVLMVGNDVERDLAPARKLGLATYHVMDALDSSTVVAGAGPRGNLKDLRLWLESADLAALEPSFKAKESVLAIMASTPAVLHDLLSGLSAESWSRESTPEDWAVIEVLCHVRDTELEVHQMQLQTLREQTRPFIPRPDAAVWAKQRKYLNEDGPAALRAFTAARIETLKQLDAVGDRMWLRRARHAIFGPTDFLEVVGFMADHDRMHIQQVANILGSL